jgi:IBR domain, a half RING-finger domain
MASNTIDFETERLAIDILRHDLTDELQLIRDPHQLSVVRDQIAALDAQQHEIQLRQATHAGQVLQRSMYSAMLADSRTIIEERRQEQQAIEDRVVAAELEGRPQPATPERVQLQTIADSLEDARLNQLEETMAEHHDSAPRDLSGPSVADSAVVIRDGQNEEGRDMSDDTAQDCCVSLEHYMAVLALDESHPLVECIVCAESFPVSQVVTLICQDTWCRGCVTRRFEDATFNEGYWPPRCCSEEITVNDVQHLLSLDLRHRFARRSIEWSTGNRTYCHEVSCSAFIPPSSIEGRLAQCAQCEGQTCAECKSIYHADPPCTADTPDDHILRDIARDQGWQNCPNCRRLVAIAYGCNHMTYVFHPVLQTFHLTNEKVFLSNTILLRMCASLERVPM